MFLIYEHDIVLQVVWHMQIIHLVCITGKRFRKVMVWHLSRYRSLMRTCGQAMTYWLIFALALVMARCMTALNNYLHQYRLINGVLWHLPEPMNLVGNTCLSPWGQCVKLFSKYIFKEARNCMLNNDWFYIWSLDLTSHKWLFTPMTNK